MRLFLAFIIFVFGFDISVDARNRLVGPISARVLKVQDGDTLVVLARIWPGHDVKAFVRIRGIDAPELKSRCELEHRLAKAAKAKLTTLVSNRRVLLRDVVKGKYYGRVLANVSDHQGADIQTSLMKSGLVRPYQGRKRHNWCIDQLSHLLE